MNSARNDVPTASLHLPGRLMKLPEVLRIIPMSRSTLYDGVKSGMYPRSVRISTRGVAWYESDIVALAASWTSGRD